MGSFKIFFFLIQYDPFSWDERDNLQQFFFSEISRLHYLSYRRLRAIFLILRKSFLKFLQLNYTDITIIGSSKEHIDIFMTNNFA